MKSGAAPTKPSAKRTTVLLADDHAMVREGFRKLLEAQDDLEVVGEAKNGQQAVTMARKLRPDIVVMDIAMPVLNGLDATGQIRESNPGIKVLVLSAHSDDAYVERAVALGAVGFLVKQSSSSDLAKAIHAAQNGQTFFSPAVAKRLRDRFAKPSRRVLAVAKPSSRGEREVGRLIVDGVPQTQIAAELGIDLKKVHEHRRALMRKVTSAVARSRLGALE